MSDTRASHAAQHSSHNSAFNLPNDAHAKARWIDRYWAGQKALDPHLELKHSQPEFQSLQPRDANSLDEQHPQKTPWMGALKNRQERSCLMGSLTRTQRQKKSKLVRGTKLGNCIECGRLQRVGPSERGKHCSCPSLCCTHPLRTSFATKTRANLTIERLNGKDNGRLGWSSQCEHAGM
jgi:hypothetical protein